jgi:hypothetical protein
MVSVPERVTGYHKSDGVRKRRKLPLRGRPRTGLEILDVNWVYICLGPEQEIRENISGIGKGERRIGRHAARAYRVWLEILVLSVRITALDQ